MREDLADFQRNGERYMILLAILCFAGFCGIAYVYIDGINYRQSDDEHQSAKNPKQDW